MVFSATDAPPVESVLPLAHGDTSLRNGQVSLRQREALQAFLGMLAQPPMALTGLILRKNDFGIPWGARV